jgi:hypothetical protein
MLVHRLQESHRGRKIWGSANYRIYSAHGHDAIPPFSINQRMISAASNVRMFAGDGLPSPARFSEGPESKGLDIHAKRG